MAGAFRPLNSARHFPGASFNGLTRRRCLVALLFAGAGRADATIAEVPIAVSVSVNVPFVDAMLDELAAAMGIRWQVLRVPFARVVRMARAGTALGFGVSPSPARVGTLDFSQPLFESGVWGVSRADSPHEASSMSQLKGLNVCVWRDAQLGEAIDNAAQRDFRALAAGGDFAVRLRMLSAGRCDVLLATHYNRERSQLQKRIRAAGADPDQFVIGRQPLAQQPVHVAVRRDGALARWMPLLDKALADRHQAIVALVKSGS